MRLLVRLLSATVLSLGALVALPAPVACACSCVGFTTSEAVDAASVVFRGEVIMTTEPPSMGSGDPVRYLIRVDRAYKGDPPKLVVVSSAASEGSCGLRLAGKVTVFATGAVVALRTNLCAAPVKLDVKALGPGVVPTAVPSETLPPSTRAPEPAQTPAGAPDWLLPGLVTLAVVLTAAAGTLLVGRRRP